jgi:hypothetical protein
MPGALVHIAAGLITAFIVHRIHFKWEFSYAIFIGNLLPDIIKFGITGLTQGNLHPGTINMRTDIFRFLSETTSSYNFWFTIGFFVVATAALLYHYHVIKKKRMEEYDELYGFLLMGIILHLIMDVFIHESGWLI